MTDTEIALALLAVNILTYVTFAFDKWSAKRQGWRIPEANLLLLCIIGGAITGFIAMFTLRHKTKKGKFRVLVPLILVLHLCVLGVVVAGKSSY